MHLEPVQSEDCLHILISGHFPLHKKWIIKCTAQISSPDRTSFLYDISEFSGSGYNATVVHIQLAPTYQRNSSMKQAWPFSFSNWSLDTSLSHRCEMKEKREYKLDGGHGGPSHLFLLDLHPKLILDSWSLI